MKINYIEINGEIVSVETLAHAWATIDGKTDEQFHPQHTDGHYEGYIADVEGLLEQALIYAKKKSEALNKIAKLGQELDLT